MPVSKLRTKAVGTAAVGRGHGSERVPEKGKLPVKSRSDLLARGPRLSNGENLFLAKCPWAL